MQELERVRNDLASMQQALGLGRPFDEDDVRRTALCGLLGVPLLVWGVLGATQPPYGPLAIVLTLLAVTVLSSIGVGEASRARERRPLRWRENKKGLAVFVALSAAALGYVLAGIRGGSSWSHAVGTAIFFVGVALMLPPLLDSSRRHEAGAAVPTMIYGGLFPFYDDRDLVIATASWISVSGLVSAAIMHRALRGRRRGDAPD